MLPNPLPSFRYIDSTDLVGLFGNLHQIISFQNNPNLGLEVVATPRSLNYLKKYPELISKVAGFHARAQLSSSFFANVPMWLANRVMAHPTALLPLAKGKYILMHNAGYAQLESRGELLALVTSHPDITFVVENDAEPGDLQAAATISQTLGGRHMVIDWFHYHKESRIPFPRYWETLLPMLDHYAPYTAAWHICLGTRRVDSLPLPIPDFVLTAVKALKDKHDIRIIIEHQMGHLGMLYGRPSTDPYILNHLTSAYAPLLASGLI